MVSSLETVTQRRKERRAAQAGAKTKTRQGQELEAKERVLGDKNHLRQAGYKKYLDAFPDDPYKYTNAEQAVFGAEFTQYGTATASIDAKQAYDEKNYIEAALYGAGAVAGLVGLGFAAKPALRGIRKISDNLRRRQDAKDMQEFLSTPKDPAYTAEPPPDNIAVEYLEDGVRKTKQFKTEQERLAFIEELRSDRKREMINLKIVPRPKTDMGSFLTQPRLDEIKAGELVGYSAGLDKTNLATSTEAALTRLSEKGLLRSADEPIYGTQSTLGERTSKVPNEVIGTMYSPVSEYVTNLTPKTLKGAGYNVYKTDEYSDLVSLGDVKKYFETLSSKGLVKEGEADYLLKNKLQLSLTSPDRIVGRDKYGFGAGISEADKDRIPLDLIPLSVLKDRYNKDVKGVFDNYTFSLDKQMEKGTSAYRKRYGQSQKIIDDEVLNEAGAPDYEAVTFNAQNLMPDILRRSKHGFKEDSLGHIRYSIRDGSNTKNKVRALLNVENDKGIITNYNVFEDYELNNAGRFADEIDSLKGYIKQIQQMTEARDEGQIIGNLQSVRFKETDALKDVIRKSKQLYFDGIIESAYTMKNNKLVVDTTQATSPFGLLRDDLYALTGQAKTAVDLDARIAAKTAEKQELVNQLKDDLTGEKAFVSRKAGVDYDRSLDFVNDIFTLANDNPMSDEFKDQVMNMLTRGGVDESLDEIVDFDFWRTYHDIDEDTLEDFYRRYGAYTADEDELDRLADRDLRQINIFAKDEQNEAYEFLEKVEELDNSISREGATDATGDFSKEDVDKFLNEAIEQADLIEVKSGDVKPKGILATKIDGYSEYYDTEDLVGPDETTEYLTEIGSPNAKIAQAIRNIINKRYKDTRSVDKTNYDMYDDRLAGMYFTARSMSERTFDSLPTEHFNYNAPKTEDQFINNMVVLDQYGDTATPGTAQTMMINSRTRLDDLYQFKDDVVDMIEDFKNDPKAKTPEKVRKDAEEFLNADYGLEEKYILVDELQSDLINALKIKVKDPNTGDLQLKSAPSYVDKDLPIKETGVGAPSHKEYVSNLLKGAIIRAKQKGINKIVIPNYEKMREARGSKPLVEVDRKAKDYKRKKSYTGGMPEFIIKAAYQDGVKKSVNQFVRESNNKIKTFKTKLVHTTTDGGSLFDETDLLSATKKLDPTRIADVSEATVIDITDFDFDPSKGDIFKFNEGGYVGNVDSQMSELFN
jgi:hypothetical protein